MKLDRDRLRVAASDVANFLACGQLTQLDLQAARGALRPPHAVDVGFEDLVRRGEEHERVVLERFRADGLTRSRDLGGAGARAERPAAAIRSGIGVIYQGTLPAPGTEGGAARAAGFPGAGGLAARAGRGAAAGRAALRGGGRQAGPDGEGPGRPADRVLLAAAGRTAGDRPRWMHLALGDGEFVPFKVRDFAAYERQTRRRLVETLAAGPTGGAVPRTGRALRHLPVE